MLGDSITQKVRPDTLESLIGMENNVKLIKYEVGGAVALGEPLGSYILNGPAGTGKSTLANIIASMSKRYDGSDALVYKMLGSDIKDPEDLIELAQSCHDGDVIYIEEAHSLGGGSKKSKHIQTLLLEWIENHNILNGAAYGLLQAPKTCFLFPTTNPGKLSKPLRNRCKILHTSFYNVDQMKQIIANVLSKFDIDAYSDEDALTLLSQSSRGTPRTAIMHRIDSLRKVMAVDNLPYNLDTVKLSLEINDVNEWGLEKNDLNYCHMLYRMMEQNEGKSIGKNTIANVLGLESDMVEVIEQYLQQIHAITIDTKGRRLTDFGFELIDKDPIVVNPTLSNYTAFDSEKLLTMLENENWTMRDIMPQFGFKYPQDNEKFKRILSNFGYTAKRRVGIVKES